MNTTKHFEKILRGAMSTEELEMETPDLSLVQNARRMVEARKKPTIEKQDFFSNLLAFFKLELKFYHVGVSVLLVSGALFYMNEPNYGSANVSVLSHDDGILSLKNTTISVNSSTMLTSIPTLRY
jgi:hypothetical protein